VSTFRRLILALALSAAFTLAGVASAEFTAATLPPNHHIHDCVATPLAPCAYPHLAVGFFPSILGESLATYLQDPAVCNDATDKALLPPASTKPEEGQPLRAGVCYTSTTIIHLRSIDAADPAPEGWSGPIAPTMMNGITYVTYFMLTPR
jgi:hypothetical protein